MARAGRFDQRVTIQEDVGTQSGTTGETAPDWQPVAGIETFWAGRRDLSGQELFQARQIQGQISVEWEAYWRTDIKVKHRLVDQDGTAFDIKHVGRGRTRGDTIVILTTAAVE
jgi:SPP1 family predicted phage head-tail adaptor